MINQLPFLLVSAATLIWLVILLLPWQPWRYREQLEIEAQASDQDLDYRELSVIIPARNEAAVIASTLGAIAAQSGELRVILVDDRSKDGTVEIARSVPGLNLEIVRGQPMPAGWSGKLWALEQGVRRVDTSLVLLLDADIQLESGVIADLMRVMQKRQVQMVSVMATLQMVSFWESVLNPAFIYFFKMLYPFGLSNSANPHFAAAAGGCILLRADLFDSIGGLQSMRSALIDDCTLAQKVKAAGFRIWTGVSRRVISARPYTSLNEIWKMVARSAFTQLRYSMLLLLVCTLMMLILFWAPVLGLLSASYATRSLSLIAWLGMTIAYLPTLKYYQRNLAWALMLPLIGGLYLLMTWDSALRYWRGERSQWKGRVYHH